jgi:hypothetical protein
MELHTIIDITNGGIEKGKSVASKVDNKVLGLSYQI